MPIFIEKYEEMVNFQSKRFTRVTKSIEVMFVTD